MRAATGTGGSKACRLWEPLHFSPSCGSSCPPSGHPPRYQAPGPAQCGGGGSASVAKALLLPVKPHVEWVRGRFKRQCQWHLSLSLQNLVKCHENGGV